MKFLIKKRRIQTNCLTGSSRSIVRQFTVSIHIFSLIHTFLTIEMFLSVIISVVVLVASAITVVLPQFSFTEEDS